jgi:tetratricopeptide (TPR) repeat protein
VHWAALDDTARRDVALQVLAQMPVLWVWDNIEPVAGFPEGTPSAWTTQEQHELLAFLRDLADRTKAKVLMTSRRDEQGWLGDLPRRVALTAMPMLERLELARAIAARQPGGAQAFLAVEDWRPLLDFTQGNPLTITVLTRQALRDHHTTPAEIQHFVGQLRAGAAHVTDDQTQGRSKSLAASLDYGLAGAFTDHERAILALLAFFQGFTDVDALTWMGKGDNPVPAVAGLTREALIALLDRAADAGLLTAYGGGYYSVHPAIPWHLHTLFEEHYGPPGSPAATHALRAWTTAIRDLGTYYFRQYEQGHSDVIEGLGMEEANLLQARRRALDHGWHDLIIGSMQGLNTLYDHTGRAVEWRRLVHELIPVLTDAAGGPRPGLEEQWSVFTSYQVYIAHNARDWDTARQLQDASITRRRQRAATALSLPPAQLTGQQRMQIRNLAADLHLLGEILREQGDPGCVQPYQEATSLCQRIAARHEEGTAALNLGRAYELIPALRDLDQAEHWYQRAGELYGEHDILGQARIEGDLGDIALQRFRDAQEAGASDEELLRHLNAAASAQHQKLQLLPADAIYEFAVTHHQLGIIYTSVGDTDKVLGHYQQSIQYEERQDNTYGAGQSRSAAAITLAQAGRFDDALLYARAALRDYQAVGPSAATDSEQVRQLITQLEQVVSH